MNKNWVELIEAQDLDKRDLILANSKFKFKRVNAKETLLKSGEVCDFIALTLSGYLKTYTLEESGDVRIESLIKPGDFITCIPSFFERQPSNKFIEASTDSELLILDRRSYLELCQLVPELGWKAMKIGVRQLSEWLDERNILNPMKARERYEYFIKHKNEFIQNVSLSDIASYLGIRLQSLSRIRRQETIYN